MTGFYSVELGGVVGGAGGVAGTVDGLPVVKPSATQGHGGRLRMFRGSYQLSGTAVTAADTLNFCIMPAGSIYQGGRLTCGVTLGTSTLAIGVAGTPGKYRPAGVFTTVDTPTEFATAASVSNTTPLTADERVIGTVAVASLPTTGQWLVVQMVASNG